MKRYTVLFLLVAVCALGTSCGKRQGEITASARFVTPTIKQQIQQAVDEIPEAEEGTAEEILSADIMSAFKEDRQTKPEQEQKIESDSQIKQVDENVVADSAEKTDNEQREKQSATKTVKEKTKTSTQTNINTVSTDATVYVSKSGKKFHKIPTCSNMTSPLEMTRSEAENTGRTYCKKCYK